MTENKNGVFSFDKEIPAIDDFQYCTETTGSESKLHNNRIRPDGMTLFEFISDVDLSKENTSDGKNIGDILSTWIKE